MSDQIDVNAIADVLNNKVDLADGANQASVDYVVESQLPTAQNNYTWYRLYKSGWVEQGGYKTASGDSGTINVSLIKTMADTNYFVTFAEAQASIGTGGSSIKSTTKAVGSFDYMWTAKALVGFYWEAKGMAAQG